MKRPKLTSDDVLAIQGLRRWAAETPYEQRVQEIRAREQAMPEAAQAWWYGATTDELDAELARWRPAYRIERTCRGYRIYRYMVTRRQYRVKPSRAGLTKQQVDEYRYLVRA